MSALCNREEVFYHEKVLRARNILFFYFFLEHDKPCFFCFFCLINFKTEKQREGGVGMSVYSCSIVIVGKMQWDKCYKTVGKKYQL